VRACSRLAGLYHQSSDRNLIGPATQRSTFTVGRPVRGSEMAVWGILRKDMEARVSVKQSALPGAVPAIRAAVSRFLEPQGIEPTRLAEILLAVTEACGNVVRHAYGTTPPGHVRCVAEYADSRLVVRVYDWGSGTWDAPSQNPGAGFGTPLMERLADDVRRSVEGGVKMVELRFALAPG
jgi:anti-sigma regulatory factor (Ser/Thr protein kinase)